MLLLLMMLHKYDNVGFSALDSGSGPILIINCTIYPWDYLVTKIKVHEMPKYRNLGKYTSLSILQGRRSIESDQGQVG